MRILLCLLCLGYSLARESESPQKGSSGTGLPALSDEEEDRLDAVIDRFIEADLGRLAADQARQAEKAFARLGPEAIPALIRGMNRAARIEKSCPAATIAFKLSKLLKASEDRETLDFARENLGAGVGRSAHANLLQDLRVVSMLRKAELARRPPMATRPTTLATTPLSELLQLVGRERGEQLIPVLAELERRGGPEAFRALGGAAGSYDKEVQRAARQHLERALGRATPTALREALKEEIPELRAATARVIGAKPQGLVEELIELLTDEVEVVRVTAQAALVKRSGGVDHGPGPRATLREREESVRRWRAWLAETKR